MKAIKSKRSLIFFILSLVLVSIIVGGGFAMKSLNYINKEAKTLYEKMEFGGEEREYIVYLPENLPKNAPLVMVFHGYTDTAEGIMNHLGFNALADKEKFAVCYPQGLLDSNENTYWEVGYKFTEDKDVDDVAFIRELTTKLQDKYEINKDATFTTGHSNGGDISIVLAAKANDIFKAAAPVVGSLMKKTYDSIQDIAGIPVFMINATGDTTTLWDGDLEGVQSWGAYLPAEMTFDFFAQRNQCTEIEKGKLTDVIDTDNIYVETEKRKNKNGNQVWLYSVVNGGHEWPMKLVKGDFDATDEIWKFFSMYIK